nr:MAG TPA: hypothetical protein [Caudoviricetes sp.]
MERCSHDAGVIDLHFPVQPLNAPPTSSSAIGQKNSFPCGSVAAAAYGASSQDASRSSRLAGATPACSTSRVADTYGPESVTHTQSNSDHRRLKTCTRGTAARRSFWRHCAKQCHPKS